MGVVIDGMLAKTLSAEQMERITEAIAKVKAGEITITSAMNMDPADFAKIVEKVAP